MRPFLYTAMALCLAGLGCNPRPMPHDEPAVTRQDKITSREELISGNVDKRWVLEPSDKPTNDSADVRFIFYRNYNVTTFGGYGTRQGHWSLDDETTLSFHFDGPDSLRVYKVLELDSTALRLKTESGARLHYKPE